MLEEKKARTNVSKALEAVQHVGRHAGESAFGSK